MKNLLPVIAISIILWLGLNIGLANAAASILTSNGSGTDATFIYNIPAGMVDMDGASVTRGPNLAAPNVNSTAKDLLDATNTASVSGTTSSPPSFSDVTESSSTDTTSLNTLDPKNNFSDHASDSGNSQFISAHQSYAMLLVGLGLLVFTARRRTDVV